MATANNPQAWSSTPASNSGADSDIGVVADSSSPDVVDNWVRGAMAGVRNLAKDTGGALIAGGTATALTITTNQVISSAHIANGYAIKIRTASAATGAATIAIDGLTAVDIKKNNGTAIAADDWASGAILDLVYSSTATAFIAANLPQAGTGAAVSSFSAYSAGQSGLGTSFTLITFATEEYDIGSDFASSRWTPPAGKVFLHAQIATSNIASGTECKIAIYKNGSVHRQATYEAGGASFAMQISTFDSANGTDYYEVEAVGDASWNTSSGASNTFFQGSLV